MSAESTIKRSIFTANRNPNQENELFSTTNSDETPSALSETVTTLASNVYKELERIIRNFGENSVKDLMPVMISILESLDSALHERDASKFQNESLKEQNEQLFQQYEREKSFHKDYQQRYSQIEDQLEELKRNHEDKLLSLESLVKIFEIKSRNATDHITRLEEKENEMKNEYKRLHDRYSELFKAHCDYIERMKILHGVENSRLKNQTNDESENKPSTNSLMLSNDAAVNTEFDHSLFESYTRGIFSKLRSLNLISAPFDEQQFFINEDEFEPQTNSITDQPESDDEYSTEETKIRNEPNDVDAPEDLFGMTKEVSNLIKENNELLETKNALNVLKDDLLSKIEELTNEQEILREEVESLQTVKQRLQSKLSETEEELKKTRETFEKKIKEEKPLMMMTGTQASSSSSAEPTQSTMPASKSLWRMFSSDWLPTTIVPTNILGVPVSDIQSDLREGTTQISEFFSGLFGSNVKETSSNKTTNSRASPSTDQQASAGNVSTTNNADSLSLH